jgi:hypothetical protein
MHKVVLLSLLVKTVRTVPFTIYRMLRYDTIGYGTVQYVRKLTDKNGLPTVFVLEMTL